MYSEFIGASHKSILEQEGLYTTFMWGASPAKVRFILLDTRYFRDSHFVRSLGEVKLPFTALVAAFIRLMYTTLGFGLHYNGDVLGAAQWSWLERTLQSSDADFHVVVSSIQVLTTNPVLESWGHFPVAKSLLFDLMAKYDPPGLLFLSGDIHAAELTRVPRSVESTVHAQKEWVEVTSSGLTHTCADSIVTRMLCPLMMQSYRRHRYSASGQEEGNRGRSGDAATSDQIKRNDDVYIGSNFGTLRVVSEHSEDVTLQARDNLCLEARVHALDEVRAALDGCAQGYCDRDITGILNSTVVLKARVCGRRRRDHNIVALGYSGVENGRRHRTHFYPEFYYVDSVCIYATVAIVSLCLLFSWHLFRCSRAPTAKTFAKNN